MNVFFPGETVHLWPVWAEVLPEAHHEGPHQENTQLDREEYCGDQSRSWSQRLLRVQAIILDDNSKIRVRLKCKSIICSVIYLDRKQLQI